LKFKKKKAYECPIPANDKRFTIYQRINSHYKRYKALISRKGVKNPNRTEEDFLKIGQDEKFLRSRRGLYKNKNINSLIESQNKLVKLLKEENPDFKLVVAHYKHTEKEFEQLDDFEVIREAFFFYAHESGNIFSKLFLASTLFYMLVQKQREALSHKEED